MKYFSEKEFWCRCSQCQKGDAEMGIPPGGMIGSVLAPYQITRGTLPSIAMTKNAGGVLVSDLNVGALVINLRFSSFAPQ